MGDSRAQQACWPPLFRLENRFKAGQGQTAPAKPRSRGRRQLAPFGMGDRAGVGSSPEALTARRPHHPSCPPETCRASWPEPAPTPSTGRAGPGMTAQDCALGLWAVPSFLASVRGVVGQLSTPRGHSETEVSPWTLVMTPTAKNKKRMIATTECQLVPGPRSALHRRGGGL